MPVALVTADTESPCRRGRPGRARPDGDPDAAGPRSIQTVGETQWSRTRRSARLSISRGRRCACATVERLRPAALHGRLAGRAARVRDRLGPRRGRRGRRATGRIARADDGYGPARHISPARDSWLWVALGSSADAGRRARTSRTAPAARPLPDDAVPRPRRRLRAFGAAGLGDVGHEHHRTVLVYERGAGACGACSRARRRSTSASPGARRSCRAATTASCASSHWATEAAAHDRRAARLVQRPGGRRRGADPVADARDALRARPARARVPARARRGVVARRLPGPRGVSRRDHRSAWATRSRKAVRPVRRRARAGGAPASCAAPRRRAALSPLPASRPSFCGQHAVCLVHFVSVLLDAVVQTLETPAYADLMRSYVLFATRWAA